MEGNKARVYAYLDLISCHNFLPRVFLDIIQGREEPSSYACTHSGIEMFPHILFSLKHGKFCFCV